MVTAVSRLGDEVKAKYHAAGAQADVSLCFPRRPFRWPVARGWQMGQNRVRGETETQAKRGLRRQPGVIPRFQHYLLFSIFPGKNRTGDST